MTPIDWARLTHHLARRPAQPMAPLSADVLARLHAITHPQPAAPLDPVRATVLRLIREDSAEPGDPFPALLPRVRWTPKPARYSETDDEIGGRRRYHDGLGE